MEPIRSFIAFDIEDETVLRNFAVVQSMLARTGADLRLVRPENIHLTLRFLGDIASSQVDQIHVEMEKVKFNPFEVEVKGLGAFPSLHRVSVVWAGIRRGSNELRQVFYQLEPSLRRLGFRPDGKGFSPHLTIARVTTGRNKSELTRRIDELENYEFGIIKAECLRLKRSVLTPKGPVYSVLKETCRGT